MNQIVKKTKKQEAADATLADVYDLRREAEKTLERARYRKAPKVVIESLERVVDACRGADFAATDVVATLSIGSKACM